MMQRLCLTARFARVLGGPALRTRFAMPSLTWMNKQYFASAKDDGHGGHGGEVTTQVAKKKEVKKKDIQQYIDGQLVTRNYLQLKKEEDIRTYVLNMIRSYFRTTNKGGLTLESSLLDHGLDSLDSIELAMQVEEDLGYIISAETLPVLQKPKHFVTYIWHVEQFKSANDRAPLG